MRKVALLCLLLTGCGTAHGAFKPVKKPTKKPIEAPTTAIATPLQVELVGSVAESMAASKAKADPLDPDPNPPAPVLPTLSLPMSVNGTPGEFITVEATTNGVHVKWKAKTTGLSVFPASMLVNDHLTVVSSITPGQYSLVATTSLNDILTDAEMLVNIIGPQPPPVPVPSPIPVPTPQPIPTPVPAPPVPTPVVDTRIALSNLYVVTIDDVTMRTPTVAKVLTDNTFWTNLKNSGVEYVKINSTNVNVQTQFGAQLKLNTSSTYPKGMPCVILLNKTLFQQNADHSWLNVNSTELQLPATLADFQTLISKYAK